jgi:hypothetical protein
MFSIEGYSKLAPVIKSNNLDRAIEKTYIDVAFSTDARSSASVFVFLIALSFALNIAYPAAVSASMKTIVSCGERRVRKVVDRCLRKGDFSANCSSQSCENLSNENPQPKMEFEKV